MILDLPDPPKLWLPEKPALIRSGQDIISAQALLAHRLRRAGGSGAPVVATYLSSVATSSSATTRTWSSVTLGTSYTHFIVAVGWSTGNGANLTVSSLTVAGNAATQLVISNAAFTGVAFYIVELSAASGDIVLTLSAAAVSGQTYAIWGLTGLQSETAVDTDSKNDGSADTPIACALNPTTNDGVALCAATIWGMGAGAGGDWTGDISGRDFGVYVSSAAGMSGKAISTTGASLSFSSPDPGTSNATSTAAAVSLR